MVLPANVPEIDQVVHLARRVLSPGEPFHQLKMALPISTGCLVSQSRRKPGKSRYLARSPAREVRAAKQTLYRGMNEGDLRAPQRRGRTLKQQGWSERNPEERWKHTGTSALAPGLEGELPLCEKGREVPASTSVAGGCE